MRTIRLPTLQDNRPGTPVSSRRRMIVAASLIALLAAGCGGGAGVFVPSGPLVVTIIASGLDIPWAMAAVPDGRIFFTERSGRLRVISGGVLQPAPVITLPVTATGEGGLLGVAADPAFAANGFLYVYYTYSAGGTFNRVERLRVSGSSATQDGVLLGGIPGASQHDGGRIKVGPDGLLCIRASTDACATSSSARTVRCMCRPATGRRM